MPAQKTKAYPSAGARGVGVGWGEMEKKEREVVPKIGDFLHMFETFPISNRKAELSLFMVNLCIEMP